MIRPLKDGRVKISSKSDKAEMWEIAEQIEAELQLNKEGYVGYAEKPSLTVRKY